MYDELELDKLGDRKTALFLIMSDTDSTFNFLISMIYTQLFNLLCDKADDQYGGKLPVHVRCLIDECASIGQIPQLEKLVATIRSREISACLVLQTRSQLKAIYKDNADTIVGNMDSQIFLGGSEPTTLKDLAEALGKETIDSYLINDERYLHLRENGAGVGFATYNKVTGEPLESGQISEKNLPPDGRNAISAARNWYLFELSDDDRKAIQQESVKILENIPQAGIGRRRIWEPETLPKDIRLINSHYDDLYRIPDGGVIQVDYPDGRSFTARVEHLDDYHFDMGGLGNVFHICQFAEVMERNHADFYPEIQTQDEQAAWELGGKGYLAIQSCEDGWDYTLYHSDYSVMDGGQLDAPELTIQEAREQILEAHHMEKGRRLLQDYDAVMDKVAETEELSADHRPSTLEKLAELASDTSAPKSSARSAPEL